MDTASPRRASTSDVSCSHSGGPYRRSGSGSTTTGCCRTAVLAAGVGAGAGAGRAGLAGLVGVARAPGAAGRTAGRVRGRALELAIGFGLQCCGRGRSLLSLLPVTAGETG